MNKNISSSFQKCCEKALDGLTKEFVISFLEAKDEETRIKLMYEPCLKLPLGYTKDNGKNFEDAKKLKETGNMHFASREYEKALNTYNKGILKCPQSKG